MRNIYLIAFLLLTNLCFAQSIKGEYTYIEVADRFDFVTGDNPYQLSDMMVYYFEKKGAKAYRKKDSPNVSKCDILYADLEKGAGVLWTKLSIVLKNCNDEVVLRSEVGKSKQKEHAKMYPDALRHAFKTVTLSKLQKVKAKSISPENTAIEKKNNDNSSKETAEKVKDELVGVIKPINNTQNTAIPLASFSNYTLNEKSYLLKKTEAGFALFATQKMNDDFIKIGDISIVEGAKFTMIDIYGETKEGVFNAKQDIIIKLSSGAEIRYIKQL